MSEQAAPAAPEGNANGAPEQTQPQQPSGNLPWDLSTAPEELRPYLAEQLKKIEGGITQRFQEAAEFRKKAEPLLSIEGLADVPSEELQELMQFRQMVQDPQQFEEWWSSIGEELGFFDDGDGEPTGDEGDQQQASVPPEIQQTLQQMQEQMQQLQQALAATQGETAEQRALQKIEADLGALKAKHGEFDEDAVCSLAMAYDDDPDAIAKGFADYQRITGQAQTALVESKENVTGGRPVSGGGQDTGPQEVKGFDAAKEAAKVRWKQMQQQ